MKKTNKDTKNNLTLMQHEECMKKNCAKEKDVSDKLSEIVNNTIFECKKKFKTNKEQGKCASKVSKKKKSEAASIKKFACIQKYCEAKSNSNNANKRNTKKNTKKK